MFSISSTVSDAAHNNKVKFNQPIGINSSTQIKVVSSSGKGGTKYVKPPTSYALIMHKLKAYEMSHLERRTRP